jgi:large repetitive protein
MRFLRTIFLGFTLLAALHGFSQSATFTTIPAAVNDTVVLCAGSQILFTNTSANVNSIQWTFNGGSPAASNLIGPHLVTFSNPGIYTITLVVNNGVPTTMQVVVQNSNPNPNLNLVLDMNNCPGFSTSTINGVTYLTSCTQGAFNGDYLCLTTNSTNTNANSIHTIYWGDGTSSSYTGINNTNPGFANAVSVAGGGFVTYTLQQSPNSCLSSQIFPTYAGANPTALISPGGIPVLCNPSSVTYNITPGLQNTPGTTYTISFNDGSVPVVFNHPPPASFQHLFSSVSCNTNSVINGVTYLNSFQASITAQNLCGSSSNAIGPINVQSAPDAQLTTTPNISQYNNNICQGSNVTFNDVSIPGTNISSANNTITCNNLYRRIWRLYGPTGLITGTNAQVNVTGNMGSLVNGNLTSIANYGSWPPLNFVNQNINVQFLQPGNYCMVLYVAGLSNNPCGIDSTTICVCVTPDFQVNITSPFDSACAPATGVFQNTSTLAQCNLTNVSAWSVTTSNPNQCGQPAWAYNN